MSEITVYGCRIPENIIDKILPGNDNYNLELEIRVKGTPYTVKSYSIGSDRIIFLQIKAVKKYLPPTFQEIQKFLDFLSSKKLEFPYGTYTIVL